MRTRLPWLLILIAGWALGWFSHAYRHSLLPTADRAEPALSPPSWALPRETDAALREGAAKGRPPAHELQSLLDRGVSEAIVMHLEGLQRRGDATEVEGARRRILEHARELLGTARYDAARRLLERYLVADYRDIEARELLAQVHHARGDVRAALDALYEARGQAYRPADVDRVTAQIRAWVAEYAAVLEGRDDQRMRLELYEHLVQLEPDYAPYFLDLANAQMALEDFAAARQSLAFVIYDVSVGAEVQALLAQLETAHGPRGTEADITAPQPSAVALTRAGDHFLVEALINGLVPLRLMIDTGASMTVIRPSALEGAGIRYRDSGRVAVLNTVNGRVSAPILVLDGLAVGEWQVDGIEIGAIEIASAMGVDGLLGMNFLRHFQFFIDQGRAVLRLSPDHAARW